jgi:hypothetical protein
VLADDVEHLVDIVGGVDRDRQIVLPRRLRGRLRIRSTVQVSISRGTRMPRTRSSMRALVARDEFQRQVEFPLARGFVQRSFELASRTADPTSAVEARAEIGADAQFADDLQQRLLNAQLAAELDECGDAVAQQLRDREARIERQLVGRRVVVGANVATNRRRPACRRGPR